MKKFLAITAALVIALSAPVPAYASSLDELISSEEQQTVQESSAATTESQSGQSLSESNAQYSQSIKDLMISATDVGEVDETTKEITKTFSSKVGKVVTIITYCVIAALGFVIVMDLAYITVPPLQTFLANGRVGVPNPTIVAQAGAQQQSMQQPGMGGMGMGMGGGFGGMGMGGGFGGGFGGNRYGMGGMGGMGMNTMGGMGMNGMPGQQQMPQQNFVSKIKLVSDAALNAVATAQVTGVNAYKIYAKDMVIILTVAPLLLVLNISGVLPRLGIFIADLIANGLSNVNGMM